MFFKGRDIDVLNAAFKEFTAKKLMQEQKKSVRHELTQAKQEAKAVNVARDKVKNMERGREL